MATEGAIGSSEIVEAFPLRQFLVEIDISRVHSTQTDTPLLSVVAWIGAEM